MFEDTDKNLKYCAILNGGEFIYHGDPLTSNFGQVFVHHTDAFYPWSPADYSLFYIDDCSNPNLICMDFFGVKLQNKYYDY